MAVEIQLPERRAIGPTRVGRAKPGRGLIGGTELEEIGEAVTEFAMFVGKHFDIVREAKDVNEKADAVAAFNTLNESFNTYVKAKPNASPKQLMTQWGKTETDMGKIAAEIGTRPESIEDIKNVLARNMLLLRQKAHTTAAAVGTAQQRARFEQHITNLSNNLDDTGIKNFVREGIASGIIDKEEWLGPEGKGGGRLDNELDVINIEVAKRQAALEKAQLEQLKVSVETQAFTIAAAEGFEAAEEMLRDPNTMTQFLEAGVKREDARSLLNDIKERVQSEKAKAKLEVEESDAKAVETINGWINKGEIANIADRIKELPLTETRKTEEIIKANNHIKAINAGTVSPYDETDKPFYAGLLEKINTDPKSVTQTELDSAHGKGLKGGISTTNWKELTTMIGAEPESPRSKSSSYKDYSKVLEQWRQNDSFSTDEDENSTEWFIMQSQYNIWFDDFVEKNKREPSYQESVNWGEFKSLEIVESIFAGRLATLAGALDPSLLGQFQRLVPDTELIQERFDRLGELTPAEQTQFVEAGEITMAGVKKIERAREAGFGRRPDGTQKGNGFLGVLQLKGGGVATEFSTQSNAVKVNGQRIDFPTLVPTLTQSEIDLMTNDIIPNRKDIPEPIMQKAIKHAKKRLSEGKDVFAGVNETEIPTITTQTEFDALPKGTRYRDSETGIIATK